MEHWYLMIKFHESRQRDLILQARRERLARVALAHRMPAAQDAAVAMLRLGLAAMMMLSMQAA